MAKRQGRFSKSQTRTAKDDGAIRSQEPDLTEGQAVEAVIGDILLEAERIEEGKSRSVWPLVKLVRQYKSMRESAQT